MTDQLFVVETENDHFLGKLAMTTDHVHVMNGFRGHPVQIPWCDVVAIILAAHHPLVEEPL